MKKKRPEDYPLFSFRVSAQEKTALIKMLDVAKAKLNRTKEGNERVITKNDILLEAIKLGLPLVRKK